MKTTTAQSSRFATMGLIVTLLAGGCTIDVKVVERNRCIQSQQYAYTTFQQDGAIYDYPAAFTVDSGGNSFVAGHLYQSSIIFDGGDVFCPVGCSYPAKLDPAGKFLWRRKFGEGETSGGIKAHVITLSTDSKGNIAMLLFTEQPFLLDMDLIGGDHELSTLKFDAETGKYLWSHNWGKDTFSNQHELIFDNGDDIIVASSTIAHSTDITLFPGFIGKLNRDNGEVVWQRDFNALEVHLSGTVDNKVFVGGSFVGTVNFGSTPLPLSATSGLDAFVGKLDSTLDDTKLDAYAWPGIKSFDGPGNQQCTGLASDSSGNVVAAVWNEETNDFDNAPSTPCPANSYLVKLDAGGKVVWQNARWASLLRSSGENEFVLADAYHVAPRRCGEPHEGNTVLKIDTDGHQLWEVSWNGAFDYYIASNRSGEVFHFGAFNDTIDFGCDPMAVADTDIFGLYLIKLAH